MGCQPPKTHFLQDRQKHFWCVRENTAGQIQLPHTPMPGNLTVTKTFTALYSNSFSKLSMPVITKRYAVWIPGNQLPIAVVCNVLVHCQNTDVSTLLCPLRSSQYPNPLELSIATSRNYSLISFFILYYTFCKSTSGASKPLRSYKAVCA